VLVPKVPRLDIGHEFLVAAAEYALVAPAGLVYWFLWLDGRAGITGRNLLDRDMLHIQT
jgi:hypothetical protein